MTRSLTLVVALVASVAVAQNLRVMPVPFVATDTSQPHLAYNGHQTTFKAIARGGNGTYLVEWDLDGDGNFEVQRTTTNRYDLGATTTYPVQTNDVTFLARVKVTSNGQTVFGTYPVRVRSDVPPDPVAATATQLQVMRSVAVDDGLWYLHKQLLRSGNEEDPLTGAQVTGNLGTNALTALFLELLGRTGHYVAFPSAYLGTLPDVALNTARWTLDPYAEDSMRLINRLLTMATVVTVTAADESNDEGFYPVVTRTPLLGTDDGLGLFIGSNPGDFTIGYLSHAIRAFAFARLAGYTAQVGDANQVLNKRMEVVLQQLVDALVWAQNDAGGNAVGGWYYSPNNTVAMLSEIEGGFGEAVGALEAVQAQASASGVIVPNLVKARVGNHMLTAAVNCVPGGRGGLYFTSGATLCEFAGSAAYFHALGWLGANTFSSTDTRIAFPGFSGGTFGQLRVLFDGVSTFIANTYTSGYVGSFSWDIGFVEGANFGRVDGRGDYYAMMQWARGARAVTPEVTSFGANTWNLDFSRFVIRNQAPDGSWNWAFGPLNQNNDNNIGTNGRNEWALVTLSPDEVPAILLAAASPPSVSEGAPVQLTVTTGAPWTGSIAWSVDGGALSGAAPQYVPTDNGPFTATATVTSPRGRVTTTTVTFNATNVAPQVDAGANATIDEGSQLAFVGSFVDPGTADTHTIGWTFGDSQIASTLSASHGYPDEGVFTATLTVTDDDFGVGTASRTITVRNVAPHITSAPPSIVVAGVAFSHVITSTDPGVLDTRTCSLMTQPMGATLTGCTVNWTPTSAQLGPQLFVWCVTDDDNGQECQSNTLTVTAGAPNLPPSAPRLDMPVVNSQVASLTPTLSVGNATDPEGDTLTYEFEVRLQGVVVASVQSVAQAMGITSWQVTSMLVEDRSYTWRARAVAAQGPGPWSDVGAFTVNSTNTAPPAVTLLSPADGQVVHVARPGLNFLPWADADGDALTFDWQLSGDATFNTLIEEGMHVTSTSVVPAQPLTEDARACWRVRADDGHTQSAWTSACFVVSAVDGPPSAPALLSPAVDAELTTRSPVFAWTGSVDPEGAVVRYTLVVSEGTTQVASVQVGGTATVLATPLVDGKSYTFLVQASDGTNTVMSASRAFSVHLPAPPMGGGAGTGGGSAMGGGTTGGGSTGGGSTGGGSTGGGSTGGGSAMTGGGTTGGGGGAAQPMGCGCSSGAELSLLAFIAVLARRRTRAS